MLKWLLTQGVEPNAAKPGLGQSALYAACNAGYLGTATKPSPQPTSKCYRPPPITHHLMLHTDPLSCRHAQAVALLVSAGADVDQEDNCGGTGVSPHY